MPRIHYPNISVRRSALNRRWHGFLCSSSWPSAGGETVSSVAACDEDLVRRLPLPLAKLYRRAHNAKMPQDRHQAAFFLWEAALKLLGSVTIVAYVARGRCEPELNTLLEKLVRPSLGHWWEFVRRLLPVLADAGDEEFKALRDLVLGRSRSDWPAVARLDGEL